MAETTSSTTQKLRIPGTATTERQVQTEVIKINQARSFAIGAQRDASAEAPEIVTAADEVVEIELEDGSRFWTTRQRLCEEVLRNTLQRGTDGAFSLPASLPMHTPSRGIVGKLAIKTLRFFNIDVPQFAARKIAALVEERGLHKNGPNLYRCQTQKPFQLMDAGRIPTDRPILLFLHGTASSTEGSFGELWQHSDSTIRDQLFAGYDGNVFAFEHRTMSESPIENAIALAGQLPKGARLHLISHSRGGLVGELLCRARMADNGDPFDRDDIEYFRKKDPKGERGDLAELNKLLKEQRFTVERFVRVACPVRGTTLASERFDLYLSILFNLIQKIPFLQLILDVFSELVMAVAKERANPTVLPGFEAMIPNAPLIALLNRPDRIIDGELRVIAGDIEGETLGALLGTLLTDPLYIDDHDLVVDTAAMFGGAERSGGARYSFHHGAQVSHFRYFVNEESATRLGKAIARKAAESDGFTEFSMRDGDTVLPPYKRDQGQPQPVVFLLPGLMGSHLAVGKDRIWIDSIDLTFGGLSRLRIDAQGVVAEAPVGMAYGDFIRFLSHSHEVVSFPYDWRISLLEEANRLAEAIEKKLDETEPRNHPITIVAHSMGGLLARAMIAQHRPTWERMLKHPNARLIMLGTPNGGSYIVPLVFTARESMVKQLAMLDFTSNQAELLDVLRCFPGLVQMLPATESSMDFYSPDTWKRLRVVDDPDRSWTAPDDALLGRAKAFRSSVLDPQTTVDTERMCYVAGQAPATPAAFTIVKDHNGSERIVVTASPEGDGRVLWSSGRLPGVKTWYMPALHGDMADHEPAFPALKELIETGNTDKLPNVPPVPRGVPASFELHEEKTPIYPDTDTLIRTALGKKRKVRTKELPKARLSVVHGNLAFARYPVMVGHYEGDTIISAEAHLDRTLDGRLRKRLRLGLYPGPIDTEIIVLDPTAPSFGAIVIGLGQVGALSPGGLARAVSRGARAYAVAVAEDKSTPRQSSLGLSVLLIGTSAGGFSTEDSLAAILRGIASANEVLTATEETEISRIAELEIIELYEDRAIQAVRALQRMRTDADLARHFDIDRNMVIATRHGCRRRVSFTEDPGWWQRVQIVEDDQSRLAFHLLTDRARTQAYLQPTQRTLVDGFIQDAIGQTSIDPAVAVTLFEMLVPNALKQRAPDRRDMVLIVNDAAARYPWELLQERPPNAKNNSNEAPQPLSVQAGMLRQLQSTVFRDSVLTSQGRRALVVGDPPSNFGPLPGAVNEAKSVEAKLNAANYDVVSIIRNLDRNEQVEGKSPELAKDILKQLFANDYRILHLAGHGVYEFGSDPLNRVSGMVIGENKFLTSAVIRQMSVTPELVFINCCHLGRTEEKPPNTNFPSLAANLATELIHMGVRAVIAAGWAVDDQAAQQFAEEFYAAFLSGTPFGVAVHLARKAIFDTHPLVNTWGAYQCYGDPAFALTAGDSHSRATRSAPHFVAPSEAIVELENIAEDATTVPPSQLADLRQHVTTISEQVPAAWLNRGDLQAALGKAFGELAMFDKAVEHYELSLQAESAQVPIKAVEQMANLMMRNAVKLDDREKAKPLIAEAKRRLEALIGAVGATAERYNLLGSNAKREALWGKTQREKESGLATMGKAYKSAHEFNLQHRQQIDPYPLINWLTADILLAKLGKKSESQQTQLAQLQDAESAAVAKNQAEPNFWERVSVIDAKLLRALAENSLPQHSTALRDLYLKAKAESSPREFSSVLEQLEFLLDIMAIAKATPSNKRLKSALEEILAELKK